MADKPEESALDAEIAGMLGSALQAPRLAAPLRERLRERYDGDGQPRENVG